MGETVQVIELPEGDNNIETAKKPLDFDGILREIGEFGRYQVLVATLKSIIAACGTFVVLSFVFSSSIPDHRCFVPECEQIGSSDFSAEWLKFAIPSNDGKLDRCSRYAYVAPVDPTHGGCSAKNFDRSKEISCDSFITKNNEDTLATHINMLCTGQDNKLKLLGTASTIGRTIATLVSGILSDKYGRLNTFVVCSVIVAIFSSLQALPASIMSIELYWTLELLAAMASTGTVSASVVYNMEWVTSKYRLRMNNIGSIVRNTVVYVYLSFVAWYFVDNFVVFKLILGIPGFFAIFLYLFLAESPKWLFTRNKHAQAIKSISKAAKINGKPLKPHIIQQIEESSTLASKQKSSAEQTTQVTLLSFMRKRVLALRLCSATLFSLLLLFAYYGTMFGSAKAHSNKYLSFLIVGLADIPGNLINTALMDRIGRKITMGGSLIIYGLLLIASTQMPMEGFSRLALFFLSKTAIACVVSGLHIYSSELWPTSLRGTATSIGAMAGRFGSILASITVLLVKYHEHFPLFLYASAAILAALLLFVCLPETRYCDKLPDTIEETMAIGKTTKKEIQTSELA